MFFSTSFPCGWDIFVIVGPCEDAAGCLFGSDGIQTTPTNTYEVTRAGRDLELNISRGREEGRKDPGECVIAKSSMWGTQKTLQQGEGGAKIDVNLFALRQALETVGCVYPFYIISGKA